MFYGFPGVKTLATGRAATAPAEDPVIHRTIARQQKKTHPDIFLFYRKKCQLFNYMIKKKKWV